MGFIYCPITIYIPKNIRLLMSQYFIIVLIVLMASTSLALSVPFSPIKRQQVTRCQLDNATYFEMVKPIHVENSPFIHQKLKREDLVKATYFEVIK